MSKRLSLLIVTVLLLVGLFPTPVAAWSAKVDAWVLHTASQGPTEFLVVLSEQADLSASAQMDTKLEKGTYAYQALTALAARTQPAVIAALESYGVEYRPYWVANLIWVRGGLEVVQAMAQRPDVALVAANPQVHLSDPVEQQPAGPGAPEAVEWNIQKVNADDVWAAGFTGQGVVIGGQDTGYRWDHNALKPHYRGWNGTSADHNYNWHDAIHTGGSTCGPDAAAPCDDYGHGTHTMGTMVGDDGAGNQVGMAPGAQWIGCRNMDGGTGTPTTYTECFQWFLAPTRLNGQDPRPDLAPHVISNSWGCPPSEGCDAGAVAALQTVVANVRAAGIMVVASAGNYGNSGCGTVNDPPGIYGATFTVGSTDSSDTIASSSSRGPADYTGLRKPDVSAPGVGIRSTTYGSTSSYGPMSGTSMAAPHVTGLVALLISADPALAGNVDAIEDVIEQTAIPRTTSENCGSLPGSQVPNNTYGWGRIDAYAALLALSHHLEIEKSASAASVQAGGLITYTLTVTHEHPTAAATAVLISDTLPAGTTFVNASAPYSLNGDTIQWSFTSLGAGDSQVVTLTVQVPITATGTIVNAEYGAGSAEVAPVSGPPVSTQLTPSHKVYLPLTKK